MDLSSIFGFFPGLGHLFPNELAYDYKVGGILWGIVIVAYPFFTGLIAGSFVVSSLAYGFGNKRYYKVAGLALLLTGALMVAPMFPMVDLKQPQRAYEIFTRPHIKSSEMFPGVSPMAVFGVIYLAYLVLLAIEIIFTFRADMARKAAETGKLRYRIFSLGMGYSEKEVRRDRTIIKILALVGIPLAATFHAYVGFLFSSIKGRIIWQDPIIPAHFLSSAIFSGTALVTLVYYFFARAGRKVDINIMKGLGWIMLWSLLISLGLELISEASRTYYLLPANGMEFYEQIKSGMATRAVYYPLSIIILILLLFPRLRNNIKVLLVTSVLALIQVALYRWIVIITPQLLSRTDAGFIEYSIEAHEIRLIIGVVALSAFIFTILTWLFPWDGKYATHSDEITSTMEVKE